VVAGVCTLLMRPSRLVRVAIVLKPSTLLRLHRALTTRKYRRLFSATVRKKPGPKGPSREVIAAVVDMKQRNPTWGCARIAQQITLAFDIPMNKDVVRRILAIRYTPKRNAAGPSWLTVLGHAKDSLWSVDLFRCESAILRAHWVLVVMDQCTRRIVGFGVHRGAVDGVGLCRMFNRATRGHTPPTSLSSDHDRLYEFHRWQANLRILDVKEIKTVPYAPLSHPFVERLIGTIRRECLNLTLFWTAADLELTLFEFQRYYNGHRAHAGVEGRPPVSIRTRVTAARVSVRIAGSRTVVGSITRRWRREACARDMRAAFCEVGSCRLIKIGRVLVLEGTCVNPHCEFIQFIRASLPLMIGISPRTRSGRRLPTRTSSLASRRSCCHQPSPST
jgi:putative transposase